MRREKTEVGVAELKAKLSGYLRAVKSGRSITVLDRGHPVAQLVPIPPVHQLTIRKATKSWDTFVPPPPLKRKTNSLAALRAERRDRF